MQRRYREGFTLIELLIVVAIIGLLVAMLIPNLLDAISKAKQKRTMADMRVVGTAMMAWLTDHANGAAAGASATVELASYGSVRSSAELATLLAPRYIQDVPVRDGFKHNLDYYLRTDNPGARTVMLIRSRGLLGLADGTSYTPGAFVATDYQRDIIWADGFFVRWPQGAAAN
jgi:prepilin-type N-terminal cleavage/methylation domain-containing protein